MPMPRAFEDDVAVVLANCYQWGLSLNQLEEAFGFSYTSIQRSFGRIGCPLRTKGEGTRLAAPRISAARIAWSEKHAKGTRITSNGYVEYTRGPHKGRFVHRILVEERIGRPLLREEHVHHDNRNRQDNTSSNIGEMLGSDHIRLHAIENAPKRKRRPDGTFAPGRITDEAVV